VAKSLAKKPAKPKAPSPAAKKPSPKNNKAKPAKAVKASPAKSVAKPAAKPVAKPAKVVAKTVAKTVAKPVAKPVTKPVAKPVVAAVPAKGKPLPKPVGKPVVPPAPARSNGMSVVAVASAKTSVRPPVEPPFVMPVVKPGQNAAGLKSKDVEFFRNLLLVKRRELLGDVHSMEMEALRSTSGSNLSNLPMHMADMGTDNYEQEFTLGLVEKDRQLLREIDLALAKLRDGTYGICEGTGKPITRARLEAKPWARYSIEYTIKLEKGLVRR
jgi:DnaK suppressor protein